MTEKTKVRIALAIDAKGIWSAYGGSTLDEEEAMGFAVENIEEGERRYFIEAFVEKPEKGPEVVAGVAVEVKP